MGTFQREAVEKIKTHILYSIPFSGSSAVYEIMWGKWWSQGGAQMTIMMRRKDAIFIQIDEGKKEETHLLIFNPLKTKRSLLYLKTQFVPRSKHFSSRL